MEERTMGCLPSPMDRRDYHVSFFYPVETIHTANFQPKDLIKAEFQGGVGACVAFGQELQTAYHELKERGVLERFDQNYLYGYRKPEHHQGEGMYPREAYETSHLWGIAPKGLLPYTSPRPYFILKDLKISPEVHSAAVFQRIRSYFQVSNNVQEIKTALEHGAVGITIPVYDSFMNCPASGILPMPNVSSENLQGYHFIVIIGWVKIGYQEYWIVQNSWSRWGDSKMYAYSMGYMPLNYPMYERWGVIDEELPPIKRKGVKIEMWIDNPIAKVNGTDYQIDPADANVVPIIVGSRARLPIRFIGDAFECKTEWKESEKKVTIWK